LKNSQSPIFNKSNVKDEIEKKNQTYKTKKSNCKPKKLLSPPESTSQTYRSVYKIKITRYKKNKENHETQFLKKSMLNQEMEKK
jgi:hypothetical protein